ncbi:MFS transporter [Chloroflexota bacterium]
MTSYKVGPSPDTKSGIFYGYIVVTASLFMKIAMWGAYFSFGIFFKPVLTEFGWMRAMTAGAFSLSMAIQGLLGTAMGEFTDRFGPRVVMTLCGLLFGLGHLLMSQINSVWQLYLYYGVIIGIGMSGVMVSLMTTVARWFVKRRSMMSGVVLIGTGIGSLITPPVASWLISAYDWRMSYIIVGGVVLAIVIITAQFLRRDPAQMGLMPYGIYEKGEPESKSEVIALSPRETLNTKQFWVICAQFSCFGVGMFATMVHIAPHAMDLGASAGGAASVLATIGGLVIVGRVVLGHIGDRIGNKNVFVIGFILFTGAFLWLAPAKEPWMVYPFAVVYGFAQGGMGASQSPLVAGFFGLRSHGLIFGLTGIGFTSGAALGPWLAGYTFDMTGSYQIAFLSCAAISIIGLLLTLLLTPIKSDRMKAVVL